MSVSPNILSGPIRPPLRPVPAPDDNSLLNAALWYAGNGFPVFPLFPRSKKPLTQHGFKDASTGEQRVREWWARQREANIGIRTGAASGLLVVDIDPRDGGDDSWEDLIHRYGRPPDTAEQLTGGDGRHIVFRHSVGVCCGDLASGIQYKGEGGYIVAAPSVHPDTGKVYSWDGVKGFAELLSIAEAPAWLLDAIGEGRRSAQCQGHRPGGLVFKEGERNTKLTSLAGAMRRRGMSVDSIAAALLEENRLRCTPPLPEKEVRRIASSISRYAPENDREEDSTHSTDEDAGRLDKKWGVRTPEQLRRRVEEQQTQRYIINGLIRERSLVLVVGESGLGKTPLVYQMAVCVAAGVPFLGDSVERGRVLYVDSENGLSEITEMIEKLSRFVGLQGMPERLRVFSLNDCPPDWGQAGRGLTDLIADVRPLLVVVDPITAVHPEIETKNCEVNKIYREFRKVIREVGCSIISVHHPRKPTEEKTRVRLSLADGDIRRWFLGVRGPSSLVNGCDVRLGVDSPGRSIQVLSEREEVALAVGGYGRIRGEIPITNLIRVRDEDGEPLGYRRASGVVLLANEEQIRAYHKLGRSFRHCDAKKAYSRGPQATTDFVNKCIAVGILRKSGRQYEKLEPTD